MMFIVCVDIGLQSEHLSGSTLVNCCVCHVKMWLSPATRRRPESQGAKCICPKCADKLVIDKMISEEQVNVVGLNEEQLREIRAHYNRDKEFHS